MSSYHVTLEQFTGPLDLLLHLIRVNEMDIFDLDIARITEQYVAVIEAEGVRDLAGAYHFLALAATLVEIKSRLLLPQAKDEEAGGEDEGEPPDPRLQLAQQLAAYEGIKQVTEDLEHRFELIGKHWPRQVVEQLEAEIVYSMDSLSVYDLMNTFAEVLERPRFQQITIFREDYDLQEARRWLSTRLATDAATLSAVLAEQPDVLSVIVTFIAVLDMIKDEELSFTRLDDGSLQIARAAPGALPE